MYNLDDFFNILNDFAPLSISHKMIENGDYDNSGILVRCHDSVKKVLFSLDLSIWAVEKAISEGADTIVTHHPAIYSPLKSLSIIDTSSKAVVLAIKNNINVISMHLNLDLAKEGIDYYLAKGLGAKELAIIDYLDEQYGYGKQFVVNNSLNEIIDNIKINFQTDRLLVYGKEGKSQDFINNKGKKVIASFCGGGSSHALNAVLENKTCADIIITSDMPHHVIKQLIENDKIIILITHYASENYGFGQFFNYVKNKTKNIINSEIFTDLRFL